MPPTQAYPVAQEAVALHAPAPSHSPLAWVDEGQLPTQAPSAVLAGTLWQLPACPEMLHDWQSGQLADAQQTPSVQLPLAHSLGCVQAVPLGRFWQKPPMQVYPLATSQLASTLAVVQLVAQAVPLHK